MPIDENKKIIVLMSYKQIFNANTVLRMHVDKDGDLEILRKYAMSDEFIEVINSVIKTYSAAMKEIRESKKEKE